MELTCTRCSKSFTRRGPGPIPRYCSASCRAAACNARAAEDGRLAQWVETSRSRRIKGPRELHLTCRQCNEAFTHLHTTGWHPKYCSPLCSGRYHAATRIAEGRWALYNEARRGPGAQCADCGVQLRTGALRCMPCNGDRPHIPDAVRRAVYERDLWECQLCDLPVDPAAKLPNLYSPSLDHVVPFSLGGSDEESNLQMAHFICNARRQDRPLPR